MTLPRSRWRLLHTPAAQGAWNMAVDEAILEATGRGEVLPTLRLYAWDPPCLSLGYAQPIADVDLALLSSFGWDLVRRPTGGRAILHTDELTYAVIGPQDDPRLTGGILESYRRLAQALLQALNQLGIPAVSSDNPSANNTSNPVCFEVPSNYEITVNGKKLVGSAQARRREGILQHGSLPLSGDLARIVQALRFPSEQQRAVAAERLLAHATTVECVLGALIGWGTVAQAFAGAFEAALNLELLPAELSPWEVERARELVSEKYANPAWTGRV